MNVTLKQIADIAGVSRGTVDRALHNREGINLQVKERILTVAKELGYRPNLAGRQLSSGKAKTRFGVVLPQNDNTGFWNDVHKGIVSAQRELWDYGVEVLLRNYAHYTAKEQIEIIDQLVECGISGLAIVPINTPVITKKLQCLTDCGIPVIMFNSITEDFVPVCYVGADYNQSGRTAAGLLHMLAAGKYVNLAIMIGASSMFSGPARIAGFLQELHALGTAASLIDTYKLFSDDEVNDKEYAYNFSTHMLNQHPEVNAIFTVSGAVKSVAQAIEDVGRTGTILHIAFDLNEDTIGPLQNGSITAVIGQESFQQGYQPLKLLFNHVVNEIPISNEIILKNEIFIKQNIAREQFPYARTDSTPDFVLMR